ncbi:MAG: flagellar hook-length control protein FliK [Solirubrobacteraceae bacterium]
MSQAFTAPVSGAAQAAATRTARTPAGGSGPPPGGNETPAFSSVLDHHVARTAHAEGQHKTTGDSGGRRSGHGHGAGKGHHSHKSASAAQTTGGHAATGSGASGRRRHHGSVDLAQATTQPSADQTSNVTARTHAVRAATPAVEQAQPAPVDTTTAAETAVVSTAATPALPSASGPGDAGQGPAGDSAQTSSFIAATIKPAPAPGAAATPGIEPTAADQIDAADQQSSTAQPTGPQTAQPPATEAPTAPDAVTSDTTAAPTTQSPTPANEAATTVSGQADAPTAKHSAKTAGPAAAHGDAQTDAPTTTSATARPQAPNAGTQDAGQNGSGGQPQPSPAQASLHAPAADTQSQPDEAAPAQATNPTVPTPGVTAAPTPQAAPTAPTAATAAATGPARYGIGLSEAVETVKTTIELGSRQGFSQAKIQLAPASLGQITIHLQKTSDGIVAKVVADHSAAAQTMQQGGDDLRRSLQNSGLHLLRLDIETRADQRGSAGSGAHSSQSDRTAGDNETASAGDDGASQSTTLVLPNGALVNVLA